MSDHDTPPPMEPSSTPGNDALPPMPPSSASFAGLPMDAPTTAGVGLGQGKTSEADEKLFGMLAHLLGIVSSFIGALVIWQIKKEESPFVTDQGKEALNFQITIASAYVALMLLSFIPIVGCFTSIAILLVGVASLVFCIIGGLDANKGKVYRYPFALRLIK